MRAADVRTALARKFCAPEYALFYEVANATGSAATRSADAIAMGLWPSRGLYLQGFEIKVSRSDWLSELKNPAKAEEIAQFCHHWWIVTPPGIVKPGELPEGWGLYEVHGNGLRVSTPAPVNPGEVAISKRFLAALLRRANEHADRELANKVADAMRDERAAIDKRVEELVARELERSRYAREKAEKALAAMHAAAGVAQDDPAPYRWFDDESFAQAVGLVHRLGVAKTYGGLRDLARQMKPLTDMAAAIAPMLDAMSTAEDAAA